MLKLVSTRLNMHHHILSSIILSCFLTFPLNTHHVVSAVNSKLIYDIGSVGSLVSTKETIPASKDIVYKPEFNLSARLYLPQGTTENQKHPLLIFCHGGGFFSESPFNGTYDNFMKVFVPEANVVAVSVGYRLASSPDNCPLPCAYNDSWDALKWVASHLNGDGPEAWLNQHADFQKVFLAGDSAGANIVHQMALKLGVEEDKEVEGFSVTGMILCHPYFWGKDPIPGEITNWLVRLFFDEAWLLVCPSCKLDDPWINPATDTNLSRVATPRVQVFVSEHDPFRERGWYYAQSLRRGGWSGYQEVIEFQGEGHVFFLDHPTTLNATILRNRMAIFINQEWSSAGAASMPTQASPDGSDALYRIVQMARSGRKYSF